VRKKHQKIQRKPDARAPGVAMEARELRARMLAAGLKPETLAPLLGVTARGVYHMLSGGTIRYLVAYAVRHLA